MHRMNNAQRKNPATIFQPRESTGTKAAELLWEDKSNHWYFPSQVHTQLQEQRGTCVLCISENISCVQIEFPLFAAHLHRKLKGRESPNAAQNHLHCTQRVNEKCPREPMQPTTTWQQTDSRQDIKIYIDIYIFRQSYTSLKPSIREF